MKLFVTSVSLAALGNQLRSTNALSAAFTSAASGAVGVAVTHHSRQVLAAEDVAVFVNCQWHSAGAGSLKNVTGMAVGGDDAVLGSWQGWQVHWQTSSNSDEPVAFSTTIKNYANEQDVLFEYSFPAGASGTSVAQCGGHEDFDAAMVEFPAFSTAAYSNSLSWQGSFVQAQFDTAASTTRGPAGGPAVFYNTSTETDTTLSTAEVLIGSPTFHFKEWTAGAAATHTGDAAVWVPGTSGRLTSLPPKFQHDLLLHATDYNPANVAPVTKAIFEWGTLLQRLHDVDLRPSPKLLDATIEKIGYQTDNGAMYCFCQGNCSEKLLNVSSEMEKEGIQLGYLSFQGAGASSSDVSTNLGASAPWCVDTWGIDGGLGHQYPVPLPEFQKALGLPLQLYAPYFCPESGYFNNSASVRVRGSNRTWRSVVSNTSLPGCGSFGFQDVAPEESHDFYSWFFDKGVATGMISFEPDFMNQNGNCVPEFIENVGATKTWMMGMAKAAEERSLGVQWCFATPTDILATLDMVAVSNFRVSLDFCYGHSWRIGASSLIVWALGGRPSKDTLWSTANNHTAIPGCPWTPDHEAVAAPLHVMLALMTTGPVGVSDASGYINAQLLKRTVSADGTLLQPSKPITAIDSMINEGKQYGNGGFVYGTYSGPPTKVGVTPTAWSYQVLSFSLKDAQPVRQWDLWPRPTGNQGYFLRAFGSSLTHCVNGSNAVESGCVNFTASSHDSDVLFDAPASDFSNATAGTNYAPSLHNVWNLPSGTCSNGATGWTFLGELTKYVPTSPKRFESVQPACSGENGESLTVVTLGISGEQITLYAVSPENILRRRTVTIGVNGKSTTTFS